MLSTSLSLEPNRSFHAAHRTMSITVPLEGSE